MTIKSLNEAQPLRHLCSHWQERLEGGKREANAVNSQSGCNTLCAAPVANVYQLGNCVSDSWFNKGTKNSCSLHSGPGSKEHHFLWLHLAPELWRAAGKRMHHEGLSRTCLAPRFRQWDALPAESTCLGSRPSKQGAGPASITPSHSHWWPSTSELKAPGTMLWPSAQWNWKGGGDTHAHHSWECHLSAPSTRGQCGLVAVQSTRGHVLSSPRPETRATRKHMCAVSRRHQPRLLNGVWGGMGQADKQLRWANLDGPREAGWTVTTNVHQWWLQFRISTRNEKTVRHPRVPTTEELLSQFQSLSTQIPTTIGLDDQPSGWELTDKSKVLIKRNIETGKNRSKLVINAYNYL